MCCGGSVTFAVSGDGRRCFSWGDAEGGRQRLRGWSSGALALDPRADTFPGDRKVTLVSASRSHVAALAADGALFTWGENAFGALGVETIAAQQKGKETTTTKFRFRENARATPTRVEALAGKRVTSVSCGRWHTAAVADGEVYAWGDADGGKLGRVCLGDELPLDVQRELPGSSSGGPIGACFVRGLMADARARRPRFGPGSRRAHLLRHVAHALLDGGRRAVHPRRRRAASVAGSVEEAPARVTFAKRSGENSKNGVFQKHASVTLIASGSSTRRRGRR